MNTPTHSVVVPFPQAFASLPKKRGPFPSAPRYGRPSRHQADRPPTVRWECALRRGSTPSIRQVAHAHVDTLVLLPRGTLYPGTRAATLLTCCMCKRSIDTFSHRGQKVEIDACGRGLFIPCLERQGLSSPFSVMFLGFWFRLWLCDLRDTLVFDALCLCWDRIRGVFFYFWQTGLSAIHHLFESFTHIL